MAQQESKNRVSHSPYASLPPMRSWERMNWTQDNWAMCFPSRAPSCPACSVSTWHFYELLHQYQPEKDFNTACAVNMQSQIVFIKMKELMHPSISVGVSRLHISEGFGWVQLFFFPIPIVYNKSFIILKSELTFLSLPVQLFFHLANPRFFLLSSLWGKN